MNNTWPSLKLMTAMPSRTSSSDASSVASSSASSMSVKLEARIYSKDPDERHLHKIPEDLCMLRARLLQPELFPAPRRGHSGSKKSRSESSPRRTTYDPGGCLAKNPGSNNHKENNSNNLHNTNHPNSQSREASPFPPTRRWTSSWKSSSQIGHHLPRGILHLDVASDGDRPGLRRVQHPSRREIKQLSPRRTKRSTTSSPSS